MKMLPYRKAGNFREATILAFEESGRDDISPDIANLFASMMDSDKLRAEADKSVNGTIHGIYGRSVGWYGKWWLVPLPQLAYDALPTPRITFSIQAYLAGTITVKTTDGSNRSTLVSPTGKPEKLVLPMSFLQALLDDDLERFEIIGKDGRYTVWNIPGLKEPLRLPDDFISRLSAMLRLKSVASWLLDFGSEGKAIAPLVIGSLLGLQFQSTARDIPLAQQPCTHERLVTALEAMVYTAAEAELLIGRASPELRADHTVEEALRIVLQYAGKGGY